MRLWGLNNAMVTRFFTRFLLWFRDLKDFKSIYFCKNRDESLCAWSKSNNSSVWIRICGWFFINFGWILIILWYILFIILFKMDIFSWNFFETCKGEKWIYVLLELFLLSKIYQHLKSNWFIIIILQKLPSAKKVSFCPCFVS